jgi:hypothetical protein
MLGGRGAHALSTALLLPWRTSGATAWRRACLLECTIKNTEVQHTLPCLALLLSAPHAASQGQVYTTASEQQRRCAAAEQGTVDGSCLPEQWRYRCGPGITLPAGITTARGTEQQWQAWRAYRSLAAKADASSSSSSSAGSSTSSSGVNSSSSSSSSSANVSGGGPPSGVSTYELAAERMTDREILATLAQHLWPRGTAAAAAAALLAAEKTHPALLSCTSLLLLRKHALLCCCALLQMNRLPLMSTQHSIIPQTTQNSNAASCWHWVC